MAMKRNHRSGAQNDQTSRRSTGATAQIPRPGTADPRSTAHQEQKLFSRRSMNREVNSTNLIAPVPVQASRPHLSLLADSQSFSGTTAFKTLQRSNFLSKHLKLVWKYLRVSPLALRRLQSLPQIPLQKPMSPLKRPP